MGYLLDAEHPEHGDEEILLGLLEHLVAGTAFAVWVKHTYGLNGRWILIVDDGCDLRMFTDPMGLRQVFYTDPALTTDYWCATQPGLIADELRLEIDPVAGEYINAPAIRAWPEYLLPADTSPYSEIRHPLPNHLLDLNTRACTRFWPDAPVGALALNECASSSGELLRRIMRCAAARFDLALGLSAGWDSRLLLAASRDIADRIHFCTFARETETVVTARSLARFTSFHLADQMEQMPFVVRAWERWLAGLGNTYDLNILDLFYWEHWGGNFAAMDQAETDMALDSLTPFNCRLLLTRMLAAPEFIAITIVRACTRK